MQKELKIFIGGLVLLSLGLLLTFFGNSNYSMFLIAIGVTMESFAVLLFAYNKLKK